MCWLPKFCFSHACCMCILNVWTLVYKYFLTHLWNLLPAWTGNSVVLTQQCRMFSPRGKANTKPLLRLSSSWDLTELDCSRQKDSGFCGNTLNEKLLPPCSHTLTSPGSCRCCLLLKGVHACVRACVCAWVWFFSSVFQSWNKTESTEILWTGTKEKFHQFAQLNINWVKLSNTHIWHMKLKKTQFSSCYGQYQSLWVCREIVIVIAVWFWIFQYLL